MARIRRVSLESAQRELSSAQAEYMRLISVPTPLLLRAIDESLTPTQKKYITAYYFKAKTLEEIAKECGVNVATVSRTVKRARARLIDAFRYYKAIK